MAEAAGGAFDGFLPQITGRLGPVRWVDAPAAGTGDRGFAVFCLGAPGGETVTAVTSGLRFRRIGAGVPRELCCTLLAGQDEIAHRVLVHAARTMSASGTGLTHGTLVAGARPFPPETAMAGVVCAGHPFTDADFELVRGPDGRVRLRIMTLIPATAAELAFAAQRGPAALFALWETLEGDLADLDRPSAV